MLVAPERGDHCGEARLLNSNATASGVLLASVSDRNKSNLLRIERREPAKANKFIGCRLWQKAPSLDLLIGSGNVTWAQIKERLVGACIGGYRLPASAHNRMANDHYSAINCVSLLAADCVCGPNVDLIQCTSQRATHSLTGHWPCFASYWPILINSRTDLFELCKLQ